MKQYLALCILVVVVVATGLDPQCQVANLATNTCLDCNPNYTLYNNACIQNTPTTASGTSGTSGAAGTTGASSQLSISNTFSSSGANNQNIYQNVYSSNGGTSGQTGSTGYTATGQSAFLPGFINNQPSQTSGASAQATATSNNQELLNMLQYYLSQQSTNTGSGSSTTNTGASAPSSQLFFPTYPPIYPPIYPPSTPSTYSDDNCKTINVLTSSCSQCYKSFYFNQTLHKCISVNPLCKNYTSSNQCTSCYPGYQLLNFNCQVDLNFGGDSNCKQKIKNNIGDMIGCRQCYQGFYFNQTQGKCVVANPLCKEVTNNNQCTSCYQGYVLGMGRCVIDSGYLGNNLQGGSNGQGNINNNQQGNGNNNQGNINNNQGSSNQGAINNQGSGGVNGNQELLKLLELYLNQRNNQNTVRQVGNYLIETNPQGQIVNVTPMPTSPTSAPYSTSSTSSATSTSTTPVSLSSSTSSSSSSSSTSSNGNSGSCYSRQVWLNGQCISVSDLCKEWNGSGMCTTCYGGYTNSNGVCKMSV